MDNITKWFEYYVQDVPAFQMWKDCTKYHEFQLDEIKLVLRALVALGED